MVESSKLVAGRYRTLRELGRGGMGVVWLAEDVVIGRRVAVKELRTSSAVEAERVLREARTAGRLNSPSVVGVHDVIIEAGVAYLVMELVEAPTLADVMRRRGALPAEQVVAIGLDVLSALETAHAAGIVHRDVKPSNIMVLPGGGAKLADFGIARAMDDPRLTATGSMMGTPGYMAPELFTGQVPSPATDLWALGATLFHAVEGRSPFQRDTTAATVHAVLYEPPVLRVGSGPLAAVIARLLTRETADRPSAAQVRELLRKPGEADTVFIRPVTGYATRPVEAPWPDEPADEKPKRRKVFLVAGAVLAVAVLAGLFLVRPDDKDESREASPGPVSTAASSGPSTSTPPTTTPPTTTTVSETAPPTTTETPVPPPESVALQRFRNAEGFHYSGTDKVAPPAGFTVEGGIGKLLANAIPGTKPLYSCAITNSQDRMSSLSADCEGQSVHGLLGHVLVDRPTDLPSLPLFRCNSGAHHFDSVAADCEGQTVEFQFGWVLEQS
ncbi:serine/threonine-protein kinase [Umezawaea endophytica]|uniref:non-specific serine/threonine protein kinase n=1 Tax=Umezawaea endophytica TaxID=1654476 RepID=A0A9X3A496_9PSEU|nr:serine/threonine-protein kinase [Umezawaea endophytica]MCS7482624.1 serine/threonine protein kinase [Umezawaea endophytica]